MFVARPDLMVRAAYPDDALLSGLAKVRLADAAIPDREFIQFRRLQSLIISLRTAGYNVEAMTTEAFVGAAMFAPVSARVMVTRCEYDFEVNSDLIAQLGPRLPDRLVWLTTNANLVHDRIQALPIGITDYCDYSPYHTVIGDSRRFKGLIDAEPRREDNLVLMNFYDRTNMLVRTHVRGLFWQTPHVTNTAYAADEAGYSAFVRGLRTHPFCLAPRGNGIDTHRIWEALYAGCIPIVQRSDALREFADLPILFVDRWEEVRDEAFLRAKQDEFTARAWDLRKLTLSWWLSRVCALGDFDADILRQT